VVVLGNRIVSTGYNGTPEGMTNCNQGGCYRCAHPEQYEPGKGYDVCICVHAEQNALLTAARFGIPVEGADVYTTLAPCFGCMKELLQAKVRSVYYLGDFKVDARTSRSARCPDCPVPEPEGPGQEARGVGHRSQPRPFRSGNHRGHRTHDARCLIPAMARTWPGALPFEDRRKGGVTLTTPG
jgi:tRNA(Arg) A34 adenosine deaminase TadA